MKIKALITALFIAFALTACVATVNNAENPSPLPETEESTSSAVDTITTTIAPETETEQNYWDGNDPEWSVEPPYDEYEIEMLAKTVWGEARGCTPEEWRLVIWTVLQRVDADDWGNTIYEVLTEKKQFAGYHEKNPIDLEMYAICAAELENWANGAEPPTHELYAPTVPYFFFDGDGTNNWFRKER